MVLILTPLPLEKRLLAAELPAAKIVVAGHGKVAAALTAQEQILKSKPKLVILAGAAGGLSPSLSVGDLVAAKSTIEHDVNLRFLTRPLPEFFGDQEALRRLREGGGVHFGKIASGDEDVMSAERAKAIVNLTGAVAVAWEGAGVARACAKYGVAFLEVRAITDSANENAGSDFKASLAIGMRNLARVLGPLLEDSKP